MTANFRRPKNKKDLEKAGFVGLWKAQVVAKKIAEGKEKITLESIKRIHAVFFYEINPDIAGRFRGSGEDIKKLNNIEPLPGGRAILEEMYKFWRVFDVAISKIPRHAFGNSKKTRERWNGEVIKLSAWTQYQITAIHPFCDGNGRMARIMTNVVLWRFGIQPSNIRYEGVDKNRYLNALKSIDDFGNYEYLEDLIMRSVHETYKKVYKAVLQQHEIEK
jgi:fido (protein-threonine AMPylation protein)